MASITATGSKGHHNFTFEVTQGTQNVSNNTTAVSYSFKLSPKVSGWDWGQWGSNISYTITIKDSAGTSLLSHTASIADYNGYSTVTLKSGSLNVTHKSDGSQSLSYSFSVKDTSGQTYTPGNASASDTLTLTTIPRATTPTLSATSVTMGSAVTITINPASSTFKHKLRYNFGSLTEQVSGFSAGNDFTAQGNITVTFTPPTSLGAQIKSANSGICAVKVYTYQSDGLHVGTTTVNITLSVPSYTPNVKIESITGTHLLGGEYVQGKTALVVTASGSTSYGATIASYTTEVDGKTYTGNPITTSMLSSGSKTVKVTVKDSRGKTATATSSAFTVQPYAIPTISSVTATRQADGTTVIVAVNGSVSSVNSKNAKTIKATINGVTNTITSSTYTISGTTTFTNINTDKTFDVKAEITDSYTTVSKNATLPTVAVTMDFYKDGKGIAMGKVAEESGLLEVAWPLKSPSVDNLLGGYGRVIPSSADLNTVTYLNAGTYVCKANDAAASLKNCPTTSAFKMTVSNVLYKEPNPYLGAAWYMVREIVNLYGYKYFQYAHCNATNGWTYGTWYTFLDNYRVKDYVIEQGTYSDGWEYTKWNNGKIELWADKSLSFPATTQQGTYIWRTFVQIDMSSKLKKIIGGNCPVQYNGVVPQLCRNSSTPTMAEIMIVGGKTFEAFTTTVPIYIIGKWK